jgi:hypothetical protein
MSTTNKEGEESMTVRNIKNLLQADSNEVEYLELICKEGHNTTVVVSIKDSMNLKASCLYCQAIILEEAYSLEIIRIKGKLRSRYIPLIL